MAHNTLVIVNPVIVKRRQDRQILDVDDGIRLLRKAIHINRIHSMKDSTPGINIYLGITINSAGNFVKKKNKKGKFCQKRSPNY